MSRPLRRIYGGANQSQRVKPLAMFEGETRTVSCDFKAFAGLKGTTLLSAVWSTDGAITLTGAAVSSGVSSVNFTPDASGLWWVKCLATFANNEKIQITWRVVVIPPDAAGAFGPNAPEVVGPLPITNYTIGEVEFEEAAYEIVGSATYVDVVVVRNSGADGPGTVLYQTTNGTLIAGVDYTAVSGTLVWDALDTSSRTIRITLIDPDAIGDFNVVLSTPTGMVIGDIGTTVVDVPGGGDVAFDESSYLVLDSEPVAVVGIIRTNGSRGDASVDYATSDDTATAPADYTDTSGTANWADGVSGSVPVSIPIQPLTEVIERASDYLPDWVDNTNDPRLAAFSYDYRKTGGTYRTTLAAAISDVEAAIGGTLSDTIIGWSNAFNTAGLKLVSPYSDLDPGQLESLYLHFNRHTDLIDPARFYGTLPPAAGDVSSVFMSAFTPGDDRFWWQFQLTNGATPTAPGGPSSAGIYQLSNRVVGTLFDLPTLAGSTSANNVSSSVTWFGYNDNYIEVRRVAGPPALPGSDLPDWPPDPTRFWWDEGSNTKYSKQPYVQTAGSFRWLSLYQVSAGSVIRKPLGPVLPVGDVNDTEAFWQAARDAAVLAGTLTSAVNTYQANGAGGNTTFPRNMTYAHVRSYKLPLEFEVGLSNASGATLIEPDTATVYILPSA